MLLPIQPATVNSTIYPHLNEKQNVLLYLTPPRLPPSFPSQDFGLSRHILPADGINGSTAVAVAAAAAAAADAADAKPADASASSKGNRASFAWESDHPLGGGRGGGVGGGGDDSITGGVGTYLYASPEQMSGQG